MYCSVFHGSVSAVRMIHHEIGALYVDGHADFHTPETTSSGYFSGMALAAAVGRCNELAQFGYTPPSIKEEDVCVVGVRRPNIDPLELRNLEATSVKVVTVDSLRSDGFAISLEEATETLRKPLYLHFDLDVIDAKQLPALAGMNAGVHSRGGLSYEEALSLGKVLGKLPLAGMDITLYDPKLDATGESARRIVELLALMLS
jgi:arginase